MAFYPVAVRLPPSFPDFENIQKGRKIIEVHITKQPDRHIGKYGRMRKRYLQEYQPNLYSSMVLSEKLFLHLLEIDETANRRLETMMPELIISAGVTERLKASDPMKWVGLMNILHAEEMILSELIFV